MKLKKEKEKKKEKEILKEKEEPTKPKFITKKIKDILPYTHIPTLVSMEKNQKKTTKIIISFTRIS